MLGCGEPWKSSWKDYFRKPTAVRQGSHLLECWYVVPFSLLFSLMPLLPGGLRYCGVGHGYDDVYVEGNAAEQKVRSRQTPTLEID